MLFELHKTEVKIMNNLTNNSVPCFIIFIPLHNFLFCLHVYFNVIYFLSPIPTYKSVYCYLRFLKSSIYLIFMRDLSNYYFSKMNLKSTIVCTAYVLNKISY